MGDHGYDLASFGHRHQYVDEGEEYDGWEPVKRRKATKNRKISVCCQSHKSSYVILYQDLLCNSIPRQITWSFYSFPRHIPFLCNSIPRLTMLSHSLTKLITMSCYSLPKLITMSCNSLSKLITMLCNSLPKLKTMSCNSLPKLITMSCNSLPRPIKRSLLFTSPKHNSLLISSSLRLDHQTWPSPLYL